APAWAMDSIVNTPGMTLAPGKWPLKNGSLIVTFLSATMRLSWSTSRTRSTRRNGYRCGKIRMISAMRSSMHRKRPQKGTKAQNFFYVSGLLCLFVADFYFLGGSAGFGAGIAGAAGLVAGAA